MYKLQCTFSMFFFMYTEYVNKNKANICTLLILVSSGIPYNAIPADIFLILPKLNHRITVNFVQRNCALRQYRIITKFCRNSGFRYMISLNHNSAGIFFWLNINNEHIEKIAIIIYSYYFPYTYICTVYTTYFWSAFYLYLTTTEFKEKTSLRRRQVKVVILSQGY